MWFKLFVLALFLFLVAVTVKLYRRLPGPFRRAWWLLGLVSLGVMLLNVGWDYVIYGRVEPRTAFAEMCGVLVVWAGLNAILFYRARRYFTEPAKEKPGD